MRLDADRYLQADAGRMFTAERYTAVWERLYTAFSACSMNARDANFASGSRRRPLLNGSEIRQSPN